MVINSLQIGRCAAAVAVAVFHTYLVIEQKMQIVVFGNTAKFGFLGVAFFFVLSGFIISLAHGRDIGRPGALPGYLRKRFIRLYPMYWFVSALFLAATLIGIGEASYQWHPVHLAEDVLLVHFTTDYGTPPLSVGWTLFYEIQFYLLFAIAIVSPLTGLIVATAWFAGLLTIPATNTWLADFLSYWHIAFLLGICAQMAFTRLPSRLAAPLIVLGVVVLVISFLFIDPLTLVNRRSPTIVPIALGFATIVLGLALLEKDRPVNFGKLPLLLGNASYSIYLAHSAAIAVGVLLCTKLGIAGPVPVEVLFLMVLIASVGAGVMAHLLIEKPFLAWARARIGRRARHDVSLRSR